MVTKKLRDHYNFNKYLTNTNRTDYWQIDIRKAFDKLKINSSTGTLMITKSPSSFFLKHIQGVHCDMILSKYIFWRNQA